MKSPLSAGHMAVALLSLTPSVSALSWPRWLPELDTLVVRQDDSSDSGSVTPTPTATASQSSEGDEGTVTSTSTRGRNTPVTTNLNTGGITQTGTASGTARATGNSTRASTTKHATFNPQDPAGGITMVTPAATAGLQLYKLGDNVTWAWNYTSLQATPTAIDVLISNTRVAQPWTLTQNMSWAEVQSYTWDTNSYTQLEQVVATPLLTDMYTLIVYDADSEMTATPEAGYLAPYSGFSFGLYAKQEYHDTGDGWQCASCSGAMGGMDSRALGTALAMSAVTVLTFTWFVAGLGASL